MFWINYLLLCGQVDKTPTGLAKELGISSGTVTGWKKGKIPSEASLKKIADYFGLTVWDLLGEKNTAAQKDSGDKKVSSKDELTDYANSLFKQLNIRNRVQAINELESLLQDQLTQDAPQESD